MRRRIQTALLLAGAAATFGLAACTDSGPAPAPMVTRTETATHSPSAIPTTPVVAGPTTSTSKDCPLVRLAVAMPIIGQRLDHATVQTSGGETVGCQFFPITDGPLATREHLPKHGFPSVRITVTTYPSAESARQVLALVSRAGASPAVQSIDGLVAETFQTRFYPPDGKADWACAVIKGPRLVMVFLAEPTSQGQTNVIDLSMAFAATV